MKLPLKITKQLKNRQRANEDYKMYFLLALLTFGVLELIVYTKYVERQWNKLVCLIGTFVAFWLSVLWPVLWVTLFLASMGMGLLYLCSWFFFLPLYHKLEKKHEEQGLQRRQEMKAKIKALREAEHLNS